MSLHTMFSHAMPSHVMSSRVMSSRDMWLHPDRADRLVELADQFSARDHVTSDFLSAIAAVASERRAAPYRTTRSARIDRLIDDQAWVDAALALVDDELPCWKMRRLAYDEGQWHCALSRQRELPDWLDQAVEAGHPDLAMAILRASVDAMREDDASGKAPVRIVPRVQPVQGDVMCCDNFA